MKYSTDELGHKLRRSLMFLNEFKHLSKYYIIEYFTENHWEKLPSSWRNFLDEVDVSDLGNLMLVPEAPIGGVSRVWPLSLLAFRSLSHNLTVPRASVELMDNYAGELEAQTFLKSSENKMLNYVCWKHMKPKKQHEIRSLSKVISSVSSQAQSTAIIDMGSGQGHLSRILSLIYNLDVTAVECKGSHVIAAEKFDDEVNWNLPDINKSGQSRTVLLRKPKHIKYVVSADVDSFQFTEEVLIAKNKESDLRPYQQRYLLTGLHACGDLSGTMLRLFKDTPSINAVVSVACCYMKLTTDCGEAEEGVSKEMQAATPKYSYYPMSSFVKNLAHHDLAYELRKMSCHSNEDYVERLKDHGPHLKVHCYRAVLEVLIRKFHPNLIRPGVKTIKNAHRLPFSTYVRKAFKKLNLPCPDDEMINCNEINLMLDEWPRVVKFFIISLLLAPVVESVILLDRMLYLKENDFQCELISIFEPSLSPRCFAIIASKNADDFDYFPT